MSTFVWLWQIIKDLVTLFPVIRDWIVEFLDDNRDMTASMVGRNMLIEQVRSICIVRRKAVIYKGRIPAFLDCSVHIIVACCVLTTLYWTNIIIIITGYQVPDTKIVYLAKQSSGYDVARVGQTDRRTDGEDR